MAGDPTQTGAQARQSEAAFHEWYVVTGGGASAFRMTPGLTVGESEAGTLTLNDREAVHQWVEFVLAEDGEPWATIVTRDKSLRVDGTTCLRYPLGVGATIQLPHNTLHISRDISMPRLSGTVVEVVHRDIPARVQDLVGPGLEEALSAVRDPEPEPPDLAIDEPDDPGPQADEAAADTASADDLADDWSNRPLTVPEPRPRAAHRRPSSRQSPVALLTGVLALGAVTVAGVAVWLVSDDKPRRLTDFDPVPLQAPAVSARPQTPAAGPEPTGSASVPSVPALPSSSTADSQPTELASAKPTARYQPEAALVAEPIPVELEPLREVVVPAVERRPLPQVSPNADTDETTQTAPAPAPVEAEPVEEIEEPAPPRPDPALLAELDQTALMLQATATELGRRRDLQAAHLALAEGRLTMPPDSNAYRLYNRVLAVDPGSPEAIEGLQAVRQALINRALAQLAGDDLDAARRTLKAAADTGADSGLVSNLLAEVDYRESLIASQTRRSDGPSQ